jgi:hypothetical protein
MIISKKTLPKFGPKRRPQRERILANRFSRGKMEKMFYVDELHTRKAKVGLMIIGLFLFNAIIDSLDLREVTMVERQLTWANSLPGPTYEKFDRVLMDANWESKFPMVSIHALERIEGFSDHAPILLTTGTPKPLGNHQFKFELGWLQRDRFHDMVKTVWGRPVTPIFPIQRWNFKIRALRSHLSGWARHVTGVLKKEKLRLSSIIDGLEAIAEVAPYLRNTLN